MRHGLKSLVVLGVCLSLGSAGCAKKVEPPATVAMNATFLNGATAVSSRGFASHSRIKTIGARSVPADGTWYLSPNKVVVTVTSIQVGASTEVSCPITLDSSKPGLTKLADCPFTAETGSHSVASIKISPTFQVLVNDSTNGFYSTPSGIVTTPPDSLAPNNGAQFLTFTPANIHVPNTNKTVIFPTPFTVDTTQPPDLNVVINGLQFFKVSVSSGVVTIVDDSNSGGPGNIPDMIAVPDVVSKLAFYSHAGTAGSVPGSDLSSLAIFYTSATTPYWVQMNGAPAGCSLVGGAGAFAASDNGYLGLDSLGKLGWALGEWSSVSRSITSYSNEFEMTPGAVISDSTTLYCKAITSDPAPTGGSFSSGAPNISGSPTGSQTLILVAD